MPLQVNSTNVINDDRSFSNIGIMTVGSGSSAVILNSNLNVNIGTGITITGSTTSISIAGTITAGSLSVPLGLG
jgi:hypothetical protein